MISPNFLLILLLTISSSFTSPNPKERQNKANSSKGSCSKEKCMQGRSNMKINSDCVRAPFCVRQMVRDLKKVAREKAVLEKSSKKDIEDLNVAKEEYGKLEKIHSNLEAKISTLSSAKEVLEDRFKVLYDEHEVMKSSESLLRSASAGMKIANKALETKTKEMSTKNKELQRKVEQLEGGRTKAVDKVIKQKAALKSALDVATNKLKIQENKNNEIVKSLEVIENQNAVNTQNLSKMMEENLELKSAMEVLKTQKAHLKEEVGKISEKGTEMKKVHDKIRSNMSQCKTDLSNLESVNSNCKAKIGELNICKSEISKLAKIVEDRLSQVKTKNDDIVTFREKNDILEQNLTEAKEELELFNSSLEKKARLLSELETRLEQCEAAQEERTNRKNNEDEDVTILKCDSPCTISKLASNDLISMDTKTEENMEALKVENKILSKKLENIGESLTLCQQKVVPDISQAASDSILRELLS